MAFDFSKLNFFSRLDARARIFFLVMAVISIVFLAYLATRFFLGGGQTTGPSRVATTQGLQSIQGGEDLALDYKRALVQANQSISQQQQASGGSAIPTAINIGTVGTATSTGGCIICSDESANVKYTLDDLIKKGLLTPEAAAELQQLADKNIPVSDYAARLDELVKSGTLTPEQARQLLEEYRKQHANNLMKDSAALMDNMIKSGQMPIDTANDLLALQKKDISPSDYAAELDRLVREGKISPAAAQQLLAQYTQQRAKEITMKSIATLHQMVRSGELIPEVEKRLVELETLMAPVDTFSAELDRWLAQGKLTPATAKKILDEYNMQKSLIGPAGSINQMLQQAEQAAYQEISDLLKAGKISQEVANQIAQMIQQNVSLADFENTLTQLVQQKQLSPEIAKLKLDDYRKVKGLREMAQRLAALQGNNASPQDYADELKRAVQLGLLTPEQAAQLMKEYQAAREAGAPTTPVTGTGDLAALQERLRAGAAATGGTVTPEEFAAARAVAASETAADRQARIQSIMNLMSSQAQQLVGAWQPPTMAHREGTPPAPPTAMIPGGPQEGPPGPGGKPPSPGEMGGLVPIVKAGTILFAVLDTAVNSDYPDSPVLATIVEGQFKGAKLLGKLVTTKGVSGQMDRIMLNFTIMDMKEWTTSKNVTAYAIDPDTARVVLASSVNYHYLQRFGAIMATSFLQGYASAITTSASTSTTGIFGTSTTHPELNPSSKLLVALGQIGQTLGAATQNYINIPPTVKVDSGVGLGILFMADVTTSNVA